ncbi:histone-lysine N-methyltransferase SETD1B-like [Selaginella moellendorffii]|nr:histone-lysine N-methyltransferase SETD1B-like [Selaginella moellendorffii]|eukprot:XP_024521459.1 histone-lysine N-methyltransferase SETD1B-like [Selaginella moellendorffii]
MEEVREEDEHAEIEAEDHAAREEEEEDNKAGEADDVDEDEFAQIEEDAGVDDAQCDGLESEDDEAAEIQVPAHKFPQDDDLAEIQISWDEAMQELVRDSTASLEGMEEARQEDEHAVIEAEDHAAREEEEEDNKAGEADDVDEDEFAQIEKDAGVDDAQCDGLESEDDEAAEIQVLAHQFPQDDDLAEIQISWDEAMQELVRDSTASLEGMEEARQEDEHAVIEAEDHAAREEEEEDNKAGEADDVDEDEFAQIEKDAGVDDAQCDGLESEDDEAAEIQVLAHQFPQDDDLAEIQISWDEVMQELVQDSTASLEGMEEVRQEDEHAVIEADDHAVREEEEEEDEDVVVDEDFAQIEEYDPGVDDDQCDWLKSEDDEAEVDNWIVEPKEDKDPTGGAAVPDLDEQAKDDYLVAVPYQTLEPEDQLVAVAPRDPSMDEESNDDDLVVAANAATVPDPEAPAAVEPDFYEQFSPDFWALPRSYDQFLDNLFLQTTLLFDLMY